MHGVYCVAGERYLWYRAAMSNKYNTKPEIMSPAGYWPQLQAAIEAGADAVYFGLKHFTARAKVGFEPEELPDVMRTLHRRGVKGYVTFNTLVYDTELSEAAQALAEIARAGADSIIVQDLGVARLAREIAPDLEIHGSTQMSISSAEGVELAQECGVTRVVLARELSLNDIRAIRAVSSCELEMFVHGALCVSYSGQCFSSEAWGGRSANRGQCAQACRLPYDLLLDGRYKPLGDARYLLSPGDLYTLHQIPEIVQLGIAALKIEGRYKDAEYVALTTRAYRQAVDVAWSGQDYAVDPLEELRLEQVYSRGLGAHFVTGTNHQTVVQGRAPRHRGVLVGRVERVLPDSVLIIPSHAAELAPIKPGDGLVFDAADWRSPEQPEEGGRVFEIVPHAAGLELRFGRDALRFERIRAGDLLWRSDDPDLDRELRAYTQAKSPIQRQPLRVHVVAREGQPVQLTWQLIKHPELQITVCSEQPVSRAERRALDQQTLWEQLGRLGGTAYELVELQADIGEQLFVPTSILNQLRREAVTQLEQLQSQPLREQGSGVRGQKTTSDTISCVLPVTTSSDTISCVLPMIQQTYLHVLVRTPEQLDAALTCRPASITLDYLELYGLRPAVERVQTAGIEARVASPRILKPSEQKIIRFLLKLNCPILVRSTGLLQALRAEAHPTLIGDFSLNVANTISAHTLLDLGLSRITPTHDLNAAQIADLARVLGSNQIEVIAYQHLPVFHTEHCVFCRFLSNGTSYKDCGHPCEKHRVALRDVQGRVHPVMADVGCRNTVFGAEAQEASRHLGLWRDAGIEHFRLEFVHETAEQLRNISEAWRQALDRRMAAAELHSQLRRLAPQSTTEGSLFIPLIP